jgi:hypothetical protein
MSTVRHPVFARVYQRLSRLMEREVGEHRDELLARLSGRVLEISCPPAPRVIATAGF